MAALVNSYTHLLATCWIQIHPEPSMCKRFAYVGILPTMVVASALAPTPGQAQVADPNQDVEQMCRQMRQCVGHCNMQASSSGREDTDGQMDGLHCLQVMTIRRFVCFLLEHTWPSSLSCMHVTMLVYEMILQHVCI